MKLFRSLGVALAAWVAACAQTVDPAASAPPPATGETILTGRLLLPDGIGSRGVEVLVDVTANAGEPATVWVLFDEDGRFRHRLDGVPTRVRVSAAVDVHRLGAAELRERSSDGLVDVGRIDLRERLAVRRVRLRAAEGAPGGEVRVGMFDGPPPVGPSGESVSLGSRQFPPVALGDEMEWLVPLDATSLHLLVERPDPMRDPGVWRSGKQRLFGPFDLEGFPAELVVD